MNRAEFERWCRSRRGSESEWQLASAAARWLLAETGEFALALAGFALARAELGGDSRIDLQRLAATKVLGGDDPAVYPALTEWQAALNTSTLTGPGQVLVLVEQRWLYWRRLYAHEQAIRSELQRRIKVLPERAALADIDALIATVFGPLRDAREHSQRAAVTAALGRSLFVLTGGPGTGKTHTIARLIAAWRQRFGAAVRIALAAPTGKAARRMGEALAQSADALGGAIPDSHTLHRLLGWQPGRQMFRHHADNPLALDLLIVDEASMIDLGLMRRLLDALSPRTALVLVGDAEQLAPVEVGSVFADIDRALAARSDSARLRLTHNFRADQALADAAEAVQSGDVEAFFAGLDRHPERLRWVPAESATDAIRQWQTAIEQADELPFDRWCLGTDAVATAAAFAAFGGARILAAPRQGPGGVVALNQRFERLLIERARRRGWPRPRLPVMVTENLPALGLANGDIGIAQSAEPGAAILFPEVGSGYRSLPRAALGHLESGSVLTVHKAQGSEFDQVWLLLPAADSPLLSRQWLYTALTRARHQITLFATRAALVQAIDTPTQRESGLADWG